jgi:hypothetical protein
LRVCSASCWSRQLIPACKGVVRPSVGPWSLAGTRCLLVTVR